MHRRLAKLNSHIAAVTFEFQQNLPLPYIPIGEVFYMHQLCLGCTNVVTIKAVMYCSPEFIVAKGSSDIDLCLDRFLHSLPQEVTTLYLYSDGYPGQNKNEYCHARWPHRDQKSDRREFTR